MILSRLGLPTSLLAMLEAFRGVVQAGDRGRAPQGRTRTSGLTPGMMFPAGWRFSRYEHFFSPTMACQSNLLLLQDEYQKPWDSRYREQRNKLGTLCAKKILIKIELAPCVDSATLLIVILTVMQGRNEKLSLRQFVFLALMSECCLHSG